MPSVTTWMDLEITTLSEVRKRKINTIRYHFHKNLKHDTNELIHKTETDSQTYKTDCGCQGDSGILEGWSGSLGLTEANYYIQHG